MSIAASSPLKAATAARHPRADRLVPDRDRPRPCAGVRGPHSFSYTFAWWGIPLVLVGNFIFGSLGINLGYHRMLTHMAAKFPKPLERLWVLFGVCSMEGSPLWWVCTHRMHHQHSDEEEDPHSPQENFFWGHMEWIYTADPRRQYARHLREVRPGPDGRQVPALAAPRREVAARVGAARVAHHRGSASVLGFLDRRHHRARGAVRRAGVRVGDDLSAPCTSGTSPGS